MINPNDSVPGTPVVGGGTPTPPTKTPFYKNPLVAVVALVVIVVVGYLLHK